MAYNFLRGDRDQPFLLPPDLRDWLPRVILPGSSSTSSISSTSSRFTWPTAMTGTATPAYDPKLLLGVLLYAYAIGVRSSRQLERRCHEDIAFRVLAANQTPDHVTIARFRARHQQALAGFRSSPCGCAPPPAWSASGPWPWTAPSWPATPPTRPTAPTTSSRPRSPRSSGRPPRPTSTRIACSGMPVATSCPKPLPARLAGWRGCARPRPGWRRRQPNASSASPSGSPRLPPPPAP